MGLLDLEEPPETYGVDECAVLFRDPSTLFAYWEVTGGAWDRARGELGGDGKLTLRLYVVAPRHDGEAHYHQDVPLDWDHGRRYLPTPEADAAVYGVVGLLSHDGRFAPMTSAPGVHVPPGVPAAEASIEAVEWMEVATDGRQSLVTSTAGGRPARPHIVARGPGREVAGAPGTRARWEAGSWQVARGTRVGLPAGATAHGEPGPLGGASWPSSPSKSSPSPRHS